MRNPMRRLRLAAVLGLMVAATGQVRADLTVVVTPSNLAGWAPLVTDGNGVPGNNASGSVQFVTGPASPPLGTGSVNLHTADDDELTPQNGSAQLRNSDYAGILLSSITSLSYWTYVTSNNGQQFPYLNLTVSTDGSGDPSTIDKLYFEPPYQTPSTGNPSLPDQTATQLNTWQQWNAFTGGWYSDSGSDPVSPVAGNGSPGTGVVSLASYKANNPNAKLENAVSGLGGIRLNFGFADSGVTYNGNVDAFTIGVNNVNTTYDFEPNAAATPEPSTLIGAATGVLMFVGYAWRKRHSRRVANA